MLRLATLLVLLPATLGAQTYANVQGCDRLAGEFTGDGPIIWRVGESFEFHESSCPIAGAMMVGAGATLVTLACSSEGETFESYYMIETTSDPDRFRVYPQEYPDLVTELAPCG